MDNLPVREGAAYEKARLHGGRTKRQSSGNLREDVIHQLPTPTARDYKDTTVEAAKHRPEDTDTLNRALAHLLPNDSNEVQLMGTPTAAMSVRSNKFKRPAENPAEFVESLVADSLLPTPLSTDYNTPASEWDTNNDRLQLRDINTLLPTPKATNNENQQKLTDYGPNLGMALMPDQYDWSEAGPLLPTPTTDAGRQSGQCRDFGDLLHAVTHEECKVVTSPTPTGRDSKDTTVQVASLLPTPAVNDMGAGKDPEQFEEWRLRQKSADGRVAVHGKSLHQEALKSEVDWGKYGSAVSRWESITRLAPDPTIPHKEKRRLNPQFVEWMMGLPEGHVTGHGLSIAKELKMLGNGVVPLCAAVAVSQLLERAKTFSHECRGIPGDKKK
jgi:site-specific DNA-cytosine methylase